eukprot:9123069-Pyramimonas_sp.AAC.1
MEALWLGGAQGALDELERGCQERTPSTQTASGGACICSAAGPDKKAMRCPWAVDAMRDLLYAARFPMTQ